VFVEPTNIITPTDIVAPIEDTAPVQPEPNPEPIPQPIVVTEPPNQTETEVPYELTVPEAHYKIRGLGDITKLNTNALSLSIVGVIALLIVFVIAIKIFLGFVIPDEIFTNPPPITPLTSSITTTLDIPLETYTPAALSTALQQVPNDYPVEIRIVDKNGEQLDTDITLSLVGLDRNQNLSGLITDVHLILRNPEQAIVFTVSDATASFGSLLSMEPQLTSTFGGILKTSTVSTCTYKDIALPKSDLRVCNNENGEELLVYGFINSNTVLITRDLTTFTAILGSSQ
jgi:hypothetical protein